MTQSDKKEKEKEMRKAESVSEKGKQLSRKAADKLKFYGVAAVLSLLCAGFIWFISSRTQRKRWKGRQASIQRYPTLSHRKR